MTKLRITYTKSSIGYSQSQKDTVRSLGLRKLNSVAIQNDTEAIRGMIFTVRHLVKVEEVADEVVPTVAPRQSLHAVTLASDDAVTQASDDLEIVEGIGPKIAAVLRGEGINTFSQLATTDVARLREILANNRLAQIAEPTTWPQQAELAAAGEFEQLQSLQGTLRAGRVS